MKLKMRKWHLPSVGLVTLSIAAFAGSISGSLAWWAYSTRVAVTFQGTSVTTSAQLQVGLKTIGFDTASKMKQLTDQGLVHDKRLDTTVEISGVTYPVKYFFAEAGSGLTAAAIEAYLLTEGKYATNELCPVTTREYHMGGDFSLYDTLIANTSYYDSSLGRNVYANASSASFSKYVKIPFVFRVVRINSTTGSESQIGEDEFIRDNDIWLEGVDLTTDNGKVDEGVRMYFDLGDKTKNFIFNPKDSTDRSATPTTYGHTDVCGVLDLSDDEVYDFNDNKEIIYGDYTGSPTDSFVPTSTTDLDDINGTGRDERSTFLSSHNANVTSYHSYNGITKKYAEYRNLSQIAPSDSGGSLSDGYPIGRTGSDKKALAEVETTIWLEGWDHSIIDEELSHSFNLGLQFQINLVN